MGAAPEEAAPVADVERHAPDSGLEGADQEDASDPDAQLREVLAGPPPGGPGPPSRPSRTATPAIILSIVLLVGSAAAAIVFAAFTGGLQLPTSAPSVVAIVHPSPGASTPTSPLASPTPSTPPTATPAPTLAPTPAPTPVLTPAPTSDRYALLVPCPSTPNCYLYTVRSGDNLSSIAHYFGVSLDEIRAMNPGLVPPIHAGEIIKLPPPTR